MLWVFDLQVVWGLVPLVELNTPVVNESFGFSMPLLEAVNFFLGVGL